MTIKEYLVHFFENWIIVFGNSLLDYLMLATVEIHRKIGKNPKTIF